MMDFSSQRIQRSVPDPYYGGPQGFDFVLDLLEDSGLGLFNFLTRPSSWIGLGLMPEDLS